MRNAQQPFVISTFSLIGHGASAASQCTFHTDCYEGEACQETVFDLTFRAGTGGSSEMDLVTDTETIGVSVGGTGQIAHLADSPQSVTYLGTSEIGK